VVRCDSAARTDGRALSPGAARALKSAVSQGFFKSSCRLKKLEIRISLEIN
jgi:hypothetical protein